MLLILLTNLPRGKYKRPQDTLVALVANQLMIVFGVAAIFYSGPAKAILFVLGTLSGGMVFKTAMFTFLRASESFPKQAKAPLWMAAACFFAGWLTFPILWLMGPEGYGSLDFGVSQMVHALADLVSKNAFGALSWYTRFMVIKPWEKEQKRLRKEAEAKERESQGEIVDPAFERAYDGSYGPASVDGGAMFPLTIRRTPATIAACTSVLESARRFVEKRRVRVLLVEEDAFPQRQMLDAFASVAECDVQADVLFSIEDVPRLIDRGGLQYAAIFINAELLQHLVSLSPETVREMNLNVYDEADFRDELSELSMAKRKGIRRVQRAKDAAAEAEGQSRSRRSRRIEDEDEAEDMYLYDSDTDGRAALQEADLHPTQRLFGARTVVAYRMGAAKAGAKKVGKDDKRPLGFNILLRHPTDPAVMSRVFTRLSAQTGVTPAEIAEDQALESVIGAVEATALAAQADAMADGGYGGGYGGRSYGGGGSVYGGGGGAAQFGVAVPRQNSSMDTVGAAFHGVDDDEDLDEPMPARQPMPRKMAARPARGGRRPPMPEEDDSDAAAAEDDEDEPVATRPAAVAPPPPSGRMGSARRMGPASPAPRQGSFNREMSTAFDTYEEGHGGSSTEDVRVIPARAARAARASSGRAPRRR